MFMAEQQQPVRRKVALKIIKPGMDTKHVIARFEAERQALALMDHPNIARVLDAGTTDSNLPYFVMELVRGIAITEYCDQNRLTTSERLELFTSTCRAVQHAHTKGIIHRDIKPSNVLVTLNDGIPTPKVIDFGLARATNQRLTDKTLFTAFSQMLGTPVYMSPEQAEMSSLDIDVRSDIYSLGVLLYELLTGSTPLDRTRIKTAAYDEIRRIIREEDADKPSTKISSIGDDSTTIAQKRSTDVNGLRQSLKGELDWIVLKSLEKDRSRRYQSASDFAADVQRHLIGAAVEACPPTFRYRATKFLRRYRAQAIVSACFLALLVASSVVAWFLYADARLARDAAQSAENLAVVAKEDAESARDLAERNFQKSERAREKVLSTNKKLEEQIRVATVTRLAAESRAIHRERPVLGTLLAIEAAELSVRDGAPLLPIAHEALLNATQSSQRGRLLQGHGTKISKVHIASDWLITHGESKVHLWDLTASEPWSSATAIGSPLEKIDSISISGDGNWLLTNGASVRRYPLLSRNPATSGDVLSEESNVNLMRQSANGETVVVLSHDGQVRVWDLTPPDGQRTLLSRHEAAYERIAISPNGRWVAAIRQDKPELLHLWDRTQDSDHSQIEINHAAKIGEVFFSSDSRQLMTENRGVVRFWDLNSDDPLVGARTVMMHRNFFLTPSPNFEQLFAVRGYSSRIHAFDMTVEDPHSSRALLQGHNVDIEALVVSRDGQRLVTGGRDGTARIWDLSEAGAPKPSLVVKAHDSVAAVAIEASGQWLATAGSDGTARLWELKQDDPTASPFVLAGQPDDVFSHVAISSSGRWVASSINDEVDQLVNGRAIQLWDLNTDDTIRFTRVLKGASSRVRSVDISKNEKWLAAGTREGNAILWDLTAADVARSRKVLPGADRIDAFGDGAAAFHPNSKRLAIAQPDNTVRLWDLDDSENANHLPQSLKGHTSVVQALVFSPDRRWLVSGALATHDSSIWLWDLSGDSSEITGRPLDCDFQIFSLAIDGESRKLVATGGSTDILIWDLQAENLAESRQVIPPPPNVSGAIWRSAISPNGQWLITGRFTRTAQLWDLSTDRPVAYPLQTDHGVQSVAISPDSRWLATGCPSQAFLWDLNATDPTRTVRALRGHKENIWSVAISDNGKWLVTDASDSTVRRWSLDANWLIKHARMVAGRQLTNKERERFGIDHKE